MITLFVLIKIIITLFVLIEINGKCVNMNGLYVYM